MRETADKMWTQIKEWFAKMPRNKKIQMAILAVVVLTLAIVMVSMLTRTNWVPLTGTGDAENTSIVFVALGDMNLPHKVEGNTIMVPEERLGEITMRLREQGLLGSSGFDRDEYSSGASGFGVTDAHAKIQYDYQRGADVTTMLKQIPRILDAHVLVISGETSPFRIHNNVSQSQASVMLTLRGGGRLTQAEVQVIADTVKAGVPGLEYENIKITDTEINTYSIGDETVEIDVEFGQRIALENMLAAQFTNQVAQFLEPVFGPENLKVTANARLNFDRGFTERIEYEPPVPGELGGIIRSSENVQELSRRRADAEGVPGTDTNNMGAPEYPFGTVDENIEYWRVMESMNAEINQTITTIEHQWGSVEAVSISVLINSEIEGLDQDYTEEITDLVSKATGISPPNIAIQQVPFTYEDTSAADMYARWEEYRAQQRRDEMFETILMYSVIVLFGIMVMLLIRTIVRAVKPPPEPEPVLIAAGPDGIDFLVDDDNIDTIDAAEPELEEVELQSKSAGLEQIERFIDKDSASVAQLLRNWLSDE
ncbi:MAG: hypothetical protein LBD23_16665 [Oscillospiraceae bacterium]|nr:hypothetical protein [Oscillospiraceae bacterium]